MGTSGVQWLRLLAYDAGDTGSIPARGNKIPRAVGAGQKRKKSRELCNLLALNVSPHVYDQGDVTDSQPVLGS